MDLEAAVRDLRRAASKVEAAKKAARKRVTDAIAQRETARRTLAAAMVESARSGARPTDIQRKTGYTKERVRQILRAGGVEAD